MSADQRQADTDAMAESIVGATGREGAVAEPPVGLTGGFTIEPTRGFGGFRVARFWGGSISVGGYVATYCRIA